MFGSENLLAAADIFNKLPYHKYMCNLVCIQLNVNILFCCIIEYVVQ